MLKNIVNTFVNCFKIPELKSRIYFTLIVLAICRLISMLPLPGLDGQALQEYFEKLSSKDGGGLLGMYSMFTGGAMEKCAIGSLGIMPYISATIIIQLAVRWRSAPSARWASCLTSVRRSSSSS